MKHMKLRTAPAALAALFALSIPAAALAHGGMRTGVSPAIALSSAGAIVTLEGAARGAALARANAALNSVSTLQGRFVQTGPDGSRIGGDFYMQRPGKLRFEYDSPATMLIVSDGRVVAMRDTALRTTDRIPLESTPLNLVLRSDIDLARDARITRVAQDGSAILVTARDRRGLADGQITMRFEGANLALRSWDIVDATGARTQISLVGLTQPASLDRRLFRLEDMLEYRPGPRR